MLRVLLIDDEASARADLRAKLAAHLAVTVVGEAGTIGSARALLASTDYDLVFLDVQLVGGESFVLVPEVRSGASVIFATAHDRYAARAFESDAVDYLLKPIDPARLTEALRRAAVAHAISLSRSRASVPLPPVRRAATSNRLDPFVLAGRTAGPENYVEVGLTHNERVFLRQCLEAWEDSLAPTHLLRGQTASFPRTVRYERNTEPTRLFLAGAPVSRVHRWWRALRGAPTMLLGALAWVRSAGPHTL